MKKCRFSYIFIFNFFYIFILTLTPSHGYRWLNAKIKLDLGVIYSNNYAHKICKYLNIKSNSKHFKRYGKKINRDIKNFPNYILAELNPSSYHIALCQVLHKKEEYITFQTILHSDRGSVYSSKKFNESLNNYSIIHSMSKPGKPTENGAMEAINGWLKEELFIDFKINEAENIQALIDKYIYYFNNERPQSSLNYLTPIQFKNLYFKS